MMRYALILLALLLMHPFVNARGAEEKAAPQLPDEKDYCIVCHESQQKEGLKKPVTEWRASVHAVAGKKCSLCHGGDPRVNDKLKAKSRLANFVGKPNKKMISEFCGRAGCHATALEQFKRGPHYQSVLRTSEPSCTSCHGVHGIQRTSIEVISEKSCSSCHPAEYSKDIVSMIGSIDKGLGEIDKNIQFLNDKHADVRGLQDRLNNARHLFHQFVHVFSRQDMESTKKILEMETAILGDETKTKVASIQRLDMLYITMAVFSIAIILGISIYSLVLYSRRRS